MTGVEKRADFDWRQSSAGNWWTKAQDNWRITVYVDKNMRWRFMFGHGDDKPVWNDSKFNDADEAKATAETRFAAYMAAKLT